MLKVEHKNAAIIFSGDKNDLDIQFILSMNSDFWKIVTKSTRKSKTLTVVITDLPMLYQAPKVVPPIPVDVIGKGVASDHNGVLVLPVTSKQPKRKTEVKFRSVRPLIESQISKASFWLLLSRKFLGHLET